MNKLLRSPNQSQLKLLSSPTQRSYTSPCEYRSPRNKFSNMLSITKSQPKKICLDIKKLIPKSVEDNMKQNTINSTKQNRNKIIRAKTQNNVQESKDTIQTKKTMQLRKKSLGMISTSSISKQSAKHIQDKNIDIKGRQLHTIQTNCSYSSQIKALLQAKLQTHTKIQQKTVMCPKTRQQTTQAPSFSINSKEDPFRSPTSVANFKSPSISPQISAFSFQKEENSTQRTQVIGRRLDTINDGKFGQFYRRIQQIIISDQ